MTDYSSLAAIMATGPIGPNEPGYKYRDRVHATFLDMVAWLPDLATRSAALHDGEAATFVTFYGGYTVEETSGRAIVVFLEEDGSPAIDRKSKKQESIRTDQLSTPMGRAMRARLDSIEPGQRVVVTKIMEKMAGRDESSRVLASITPIGGAPKNPGRQAAPAGEDVPAPPPEPVDPADETEVNSAAVRAKRNKAIELLTEEQWAAVVSAAGKRGIDVDYVCLAEWKADIAPLCRAARDGELEAEPF